MKYYAKIINENTKEVQIGTGTNEKYYQSIGMTKMNVEQAYNKNWYVEGYAPAKPQEIINQERIDELEKYLSDTDWYAIRFADTGEEYPAEIYVQQARNR